MTETSARPGPLAVLNFWFGAPDEPVYGQSRPQWFRKSDVFDDEIRARFGDLVDFALANGLRDWTADISNPLPPLAAIIVFDQFTRNLFRGQARMVAGDARALAIAQTMVDGGFDRLLLPVQREFCYLPFEHGEDPVLQDRSVALFTSLQQYPETAELVGWAVKHRDVITQFGRFPHRNALLGRPSTEAEKHYLAQPGAGF